MTAKYINFLIAISFLVARYYLATKLHIYLQMTNPLTKIKNNQCVMG